MSSKPIELIAFHEITAADKGRMGGKAVALAKLARKGFNVPPGGCLPVTAYRHFIDATGLRDRILLELKRKAFKQQRWEEVWDSALRIRNMFHTTPLPMEMADRLEGQLDAFFGDKAVVVRSSAPGEDSAQTSFAGLHDSFVNVIGATAIIDHIKLVWASLWSDGALLYRQELGLDIAASAMAVVVQEIASGECSGVAFSQSPTDPNAGIVEAVYGLAQGLVDGTVEPDRWIFDREHATLSDHQPAHRTQRLIAIDGGVVEQVLPADLAGKAPLTDSQAVKVYNTALKIERFYGAPQDVEWTFCQDALFALQSRPVTGLRQDGSGDQRQWYLSLHRSFDNLLALKKKIEDELIPEMMALDRELVMVDPKGLSDQRLAEEIERRSALNDKWIQIYWSEFIPYAHGIRLFGQVYNDSVKPQNPYEFVDLLAATDMASLARNRALEAMAAQIRKDSALLAAAEAKAPDLPQKVSALLEQQLEAFIDEFGDLTCPVTGGRECGQGTHTLVRLVAELALQPPVVLREQTASRQALKERFLAAQKTPQDRYRAGQLLELGRSSYRLRDDDNIHLGRIEAHLLAAVNEARRRLDDQNTGQTVLGTHRHLTDLLAAFDARQEKLPEKVNEAGPRTVQDRQIVGQPAGSGVARGPARVITNNTDLVDVQHGEILVCDAIDPNMTYIVPLTAGIIERRGGMLIHGAIIAREYGLPCVTGVPDATDRIRNGDMVTVDGYLGIVTIG